MTLLMIALASPVMWYLAKDAFKGPGNMDHLPKNGCVSYIMSDEEALEMLERDGWS